MRQSWLPRPAHAPISPASIALAGDFATMTTPHSEIRSAGFLEDETQLVERLAQARAALHEATTAWHERIRWLKANSEELFERRQRDIFQADLKAWRDDPFANHALFGQTALAAAWLKDFWESVAAGISSRIGITFNQAKDIVTAAGGDWRADRIDAVRGKIMGFFLALSPRPEADLKRWVAESLKVTGRRAGRARKATGSPDPAQTNAFETTIDASHFETVMTRARHFLKTAPKPEQCLAGLRAIVADELRVWVGKVERLLKLKHDERARCREGAAFQELGCAADIRETRRLRRELARAERRVDQIERRLAALRRQSVPKPTRQKMKVASAQMSGSPQMQSQLSHPSCGLSKSMSSPARSETIESAILQSAEASLPIASTDTDGSASLEKCELRSRSGRRPDPAKLAKSWREKHVNRPRKHRNAIDTAG